MATILQTIKVHKDIISVLTQIQQCDINIEEAQPYLDGSRSRLSYQDAVKAHYEQIINQNTNKRYELILQFEVLKGYVLNAMLPAFTAHECTIGID